MDDHTFAHSLYDNVTTRQSVISITITTLYSTYFVVCMAQNV